MSNRQFLRGSMVKDPELREALIQLHGCADSAAEMKRKADHHRAEAARHDEMAGALRQSFLQGYHELMRRLT